jgi:signal transduction histidine kinase
VTSLNPLRHVDAFFRAHPVLTDALATALLTLFAIVTLAPAVSGTEVVLNVLLLAPLALRRWRTLLSAGLVVGAALLHLLVGPEISFGLVAVPVTVYTLAARAPRWASLGGLALALAGAIANGVKNAFMAGAALDLGSANVPVGVIMATVSAGVVVAAWAFGDVVRSRALALQALKDRARQLEVEAVQERELAAADERNRIAREMHDIVAHSLQVIITQADGGRYAAAANPGAAVDALGTIADTGRGALAEMRRLLGVLRGPGDAEFRPQPGLMDLPDLLDTMRLTGLDVDVAVTGTPRRPLPAGAELAAYRVVQEALTNTARHGGPDVRARVELAWSPSGLAIDVLDDGRGAGASPATRGSGQGLLGLRERVDLFGGTVEAGPVVGGGFRVRATLPYVET